MSRQRTDDLTPGEKQAVRDAVVEMMLAATRTVQDKCGTDPRPRSPGADEALRTMTIEAAADGSLIPTLRALIRGEFHCAEAPR